MGIFSFLFLVSISHSNYQWPTQDWSVALPSQVGIDSVQFEKFLSYTFPEELKESGRSGIRTEGIVIVKDGLLAFEKYKSGYSPDRRHLAWSVTKMLTNALAGVAIKKKIWKLADPVSADLPGMTIKHLLEWTSGFDWNETYEYNPLKSSVITMLYGGPPKDVGRFVKEHPLAHRPGETFNYSSGDSNFLMSILKSKMSQKDYENFPWKEVFIPLGMKTAVLERDSSGTFVGSSYLHASPRDLAKLGLLYLNDGVWGNQRILPEGWVFRSTQINSVYDQSFWDRRRQNLSPALQLWTNRSDSSRHISKPLPDVPEDMFAALGHWGQSVVVIPSQRLVVVRVADDRDHSFKMNKFLKLLLDSFGPDKNLEKLVGGRAP